MAKKKSTGRKSRKRRQVNWQEVKAWVLLVIIGLVLYFLARPVVEEWTAGPGAGAKVPSGHWQYGIDLSHHNGGRIEWDSLFVMTDRNGYTVRDLADAVDVQPVRFVFIKATEGVTHKDTRFADNWKEAGKRALSRGAYHYYRPNKDPGAQARHFIKTVGPLKYRDLPPVLDIETFHAGGSKEKLNADLRIWLETVGTHYGKRPIVYTYESFARDYLDKDILSDYPVWIAHYEVNRPMRAGWDYWQFTDRAVVHGVHGHVDMSVTK